MRYIYMYIPKQQFKHPSVVGEKFPLCHICVKLSLRARVQRAVIVGLGGRKRNSNQFGALGR